MSDFKPPSSAPQAPLCIESSGGDVLASSKQQNVDSKGPATTTTATATASNGASSSSRSSCDERAPLRANARGIGAEGAGTGGGGEAAATAEAAATGAGNGDGRGDGGSDGDGGGGETTSTANAGNQQYTVGEAIDSIGFAPFHLLLLFLAGAVWMADAMEMMLLSFLGPAVACEWSLSPAQEAALSTSVFVGMAVGGFLWGAASDAFGRRAAFFIPSLVTFVAGVLSAAAPGFWFLVLLRALVGLGLGGGPVAFALFLEFAPSPSRGRALVAVQAFWTLGSAFEAGLAWATLGPLGWRWLAALSSAPCAVLAALIFFVPESPFFLAASGRRSDAEAVLRRAAKSAKKPLPPGTLVVAPPKKAKSFAAISQRLSRISAAAVENVIGGSKRRFSLERERAASVAEAATAASAETAKPPPFSSSRPAAPSAASASADPERDPQRTTTTGAAGEEEKETWRTKLWHAASAASQLASKEMRRTSGLLAIVWLANALTYYSLVLLTTSVNTGAGERSEGEKAGGGGRESPACDPRGRLRFKQSEFLAIFVDSCAELPGLVAAAVLIDLIGRRYSLGGFLVLLSAATAGLAGAARSAAGTAAALFIARSAAMGSYTALYIYTPEAYPTRVRSVALGLNSSLARIGAIVSPSLAVTAVRAGHASAAEAALAVAAAVAAAAVFLLKVETSGKPLSVVEVSPGGDVATGATTATTTATEEEETRDRSASPARRRRIGSARYGSFAERQQRAAAAAAEAGGAGATPHLLLSSSGRLAASPQRQPSRPLQ